VHAVGSPAYNVFGWQKPCYLLQDGYVKTFKEYIEDTAWELRQQSKNPKCQDCMVHCGFEPSAVDATFGSWAGFYQTAKAQFGA